MIVIGLTLLVLSPLLPTVTQIMKDPVNAISFQAAFYFGLASFACAWNTRRAALQSPATLIALVIWPVASALFLLFASVYSIPTFDIVIIVMGICGILIGLVPLFANRWRTARAAAG